MTLRRIKTSTKQGLGTNPNKTPLSSGPENPGEARELVEKSPRTLLITCAEKPAHPGKNKKIPENPGNPPAPANTRSLINLPTPSRASPDQKANP